MSWIQEVTEISQQDQAILEERSSIFAERTEPTCGDYVLFDGKHYRVSCIKKAQVQAIPSDRGDWCLRRYSVGFKFNSHNCRQPLGEMLIPASNLELTADQKEAEFNLFDYERDQANIKLPVNIRVRVWKANLTPSQSHHELDTRSRSSILHQEHPHTKDTHGKRYQFSGQ